MKQYLLCIFTYFMVSWNPTFGDTTTTTTWKPAFDVSAGNTQTWSTKAWTSTANPSLAWTSSREIPKPTAPPCNLLRPISCVLQSLEYFAKLRKDN